MVTAGGIGVLRRIGWGLVESAYEACIARGLEPRGARFERQVPLALVWHKRRSPGLAAAVTGQIGRDDPKPS